MNQRDLSTVIFGGLLLCSASTSLAASSLTLAFTPDPARSTGLLSPEGCELEAGEPQGVLAPPAAGGVCRSGAVGGTGSYGLEPEIPSRAIFTSAPFETGLQLAGRGTLVVHLTDEPGCVIEFFVSRVEYQLYEVRPGGEEVLIAAALLLNPFCSGAGRPGIAHDFDTGAYAVGPGARLRLVAQYLGEIPVVYLLFGGDSMFGPVGATGGGSYGDSGITFALGDESKSFAEQVVAGALPSALLLPLLLVALRRRAGGLAAVLALACGAPVWAGGSLTLAFTPDPLRIAGISPEGCYLEPGEARGTLAPPTPTAGQTCHSGLLGVPLAVFIGEPPDPEVSPTAVFTSAPFANSIGLSGPTTIVVHYVDETHAFPALSVASLAYELAEIRSGGEVVVIASGVAIEQLENRQLTSQGQAGSFDIGAYTVAAGSRLRLRMSSTEDTASKGNLLFGGVSPVYGVDYSDAGITFAVRDSGSGSKLADVFGGAVAPALLLPLLLTALRRRAGVLAAALALACGTPAWADGSLTLAFTPDPMRAVGVSHEGCYVEPGMAEGVLAPPTEGGTCHTGLVDGLAGFYANVGGVEIFPIATFTSAPFENGLDLAGPATVRVYYTDEALCSTGLDGLLAGPLVLNYGLTEVHPDGAEVVIASGVAIDPLTCYAAFGGGGPAEGAFDVGAYTVAAGSRVRLALWLRDVPDSSARLLFGGNSLFAGSVPLPNFGDSGITFAVGDQPKSFGEEVLAGALPFALLLPLLLAALRRRAGVLATALALASGTPAWADGSLTLAFTPDPMRAVGVSHEGCYVEPGIAEGILAPPTAGGTCHTGLVGAHGSGSDLDIVGIYNDATFTSAPFENGLDLAGPATVRVYYTDEVFGSTNLDGPQVLNYRLIEMRPDGEEVWIAYGVAIGPLTNYGAYGAGGPTDGAFDVGAYTVAPGSRLRLSLWTRVERDQTARLLFGGDSLFPESVPIPNFGDSGITFAVREPESRSGLTGVLGGALPFALLVPLLVGALVRRQRHP